MRDNIKFVLFADKDSQRARAVLCFCEANGIEYELIELGILGGGARTAEYAKINPLQKVPALQEVDKTTGEVVFTLTETHAIMRYLATVCKVSDHWYPEEPRKRARVD